MNTRHLGILTLAVALAVCFSLYAVHAYPSQLTGQYSASWSVQDPLFFYDWTLPGRGVNLPSGINPAIWAPGYPRSFSNATDPGIYTLTSGVPVWPLEIPGMVYEYPYLPVFPTGFYVGYRTPTPPVRDWNPFGVLELVIPWKSMFDSYVRWYLYDPTRFELISPVVSDIGSGGIGYIPGQMWALSGDMLEP
ncbi:MAG: hypothetical protein ACMUIM_08515 [bacterium]